MRALFWSRDTLDHPPEWWRLGPVEVSRQTPSLRRHSETLAQPTVRLPESACACRVGLDRDHSWACVLSSGRRSESALPTPCWPDAHLRGSANGRPNHLLGGPPFRDGDRPIKARGRFQAEDDLADAAARRQRRSKAWWPCVGTLPLALNAVAQGSFRNAGPGEHPRSRRSWLSGRTGRPAES